MNVRDRIQGALIDETRCPWLTLPSATHVKVTWQFFCCQFLNRSIPYAFFYRKEVYEAHKSTLVNLIRKSTCSDEDRREVVEAMNAISAYWPKALRFKNF